MMLISSPSRLPEGDFPHYSLYDDLTLEQAFQIAFRGGRNVSRRVRDLGKGIPLTGTLAHFPLPVSNEPGRINDLFSISTRGCTMADAGACTFCDYGKSILDRRETEASLPAQVAEAFSLISRQNEPYSKALINLTAVGSVLDRHEIPLSVLNMILSNIAQMRERGKWSSAEWSTESRLEFVKPETLNYIVNFFRMRTSVAFPDGIVVGRDVIIDIGYGIESLDPVVSQLCMLKGGENVNFREKLNLLKRLGFSTTAHTLYGGAFLTPAEAISDAVNTAKTALEGGLCELMIVLTQNLRQGTVVGELSNAGLYALPSVYGVVEVMKRLGPDLCARCLFFGFSVSDPSAQTVKPTDDAGQELLQLIMTFSGRRDEWQAIQDCATRSNSPEKRAWDERVMRTAQRPIAQRALSGYRYIAEHVLGMTPHEITTLFDARSYSRLHPRVDSWRPAVR